MVQPVSGPFTSEVQRPDFYQRKVGYRQARPFSLPLPYELKRYRFSPSENSSYNGMNSPGGYDFIDALGSAVTHASNGAYQKFVEQLGSTAEMGVALAEVGKSYGMIAKRAVQLTEFARALRRFDFPTAARSLGLKRTPPGVSRAKAVSRNYLEFHYGWSPMIGDIYNAVEVLQSPLNTVHVKVRQAIPPQRVEFSKPTTVTSPGAIWPYPRSVSDGRVGTFRGSVVCGANVAVSNPNVRLANQMGLTNPAAIVWELIPFSFVVDWFVNVGDVLKSHSDMFGLTLSGEWTTIVARGSVSYWHYASGGWYEVFWSGEPPQATAIWHAESDNRTCSQDGVHMRRSQGLPKPVLSVRPYKTPSLRRAAAAVSLLTLQMRSIGR